MNTSLKFRFITLLAFLLLASAAATAQVVPGLGHTTNEGRANILSGSSSTQSIFLDVNRSYECTILSESDSDTLTLNLRAADGSPLDGPTNSFELIGDVTPVVSSGTSGAANKDNRFTVTPAVAGEFLLDTANTSFTTSLQSKTNCMETTLYGGYNTNANPYNFLELTNITNFPITGRVRGFNFDGTATVNTPFNIAANTRFDINIHQAAGANKYGALIVTHNAPFGGLKGSVSQYSGPTTALELRATVPLRPRDQTF